MRKCIDDCAEKRFQGRPLRVKKAVEPKRLEKKKRRTAERAEIRKEEKKEKDNQIQDIDKLRNFE